jgi:fumarate reductase subunit D
MKKSPLLPLEPLVWLLFGVGIMGGTILLTGWILVVGLLAPLGVVPPDALAFARAHELASNPIGRLVLAALIALPLWKGAHHLRHLSIDHGGAARDPVVASALYGLASAGSIAALVAVLRL